MPTKHVQRAKYSPPPKKGDICTCTRTSLEHKVGELTHLYPYVDKHGIRRFSRSRHTIAPNEKYPEGSKTFRYCHHYRPNKATSLENEGLLYGAHRLAEAIANDEPRIYLPEGEGDCEAAWALADAYATTTHLGRRFTETSAEHFRGYKGTVLIVVDRDHLDPKHQANFNHEDSAKRIDYPGSAAALVKRRALLAVGVRVFFREAVVGKDLRDHLEAGKRILQLKKVTLAEVQARAPRMASGRARGGSLLATSDLPEGAGMGRFVAALEKAGYDLEKIGPTRYKTHCPHPDHDDNTPSFEFQQGEKGAVATCESRADVCTTKEGLAEICKRLGIAFQDLFDKKGKGGRPPGTKIKLDAKQELQADDETYPAFHEAFEGLIGTTADNEPNDKGNGKRMLDLYGKVFRYVNKGASSSWMVWNGTHWSVDTQALISRATADLTSYMECVEVWKYSPTEAPSFPEDWSVLTAGGTKYKALLGKNGALTRAPMETAHWISRTQDRGDWFGERLASEQENDLYQRTLEWIEKCKDGARMREAAKQLQHQPGISVTTEEFNQVRNTLAVQNGQINTITCELEPHRLEDMNTRIAPINYIEKAQAPIWNAYLETNQPDQETRKYLQKLAGYAISGDGNQKLIAFMYDPDGDTGKSIFTNALEAALGKGLYTVTLADGVLSKRRFDNGGRDPDREDIRGKRLALSMELAPSEPLDERFVKQLTGGDGVSTRGNYSTEGNKRWQPECLVMVATNHLSRINAEDEAIWNRIQVVPWKVRFPKGHPDRDEDLMDKIRGNEVAGYEGELEGVLAWMVEGLRLYRAEGLAPPPEVVEASMTYRSDADVVQMWLAYAAEEGDIIISEQAYTQRKSDLYQLIKSWAKDDRSRDIPGIRAFNARLEELGFKMGTRKLGEDDKSKRKVLCGIGIPEEVAMKFKLNP